MTDKIPTTIELTRPNDDPRISEYVRETRSTGGRTTSRIPTLEEACKAPAQTGGDHA